MRHRQGGADRRPLGESVQALRAQFRVEEIVERALLDEDDTAIDVPPDLGERVRSYLKEHPEEPWDGAVKSAASMSSTLRGTP